MKLLWKTLLPEEDSSTMAYQLLSVMLFPEMLLLEEETR